MTPERRAELEACGHAWWSRKMSDTHCLQCEASHSELRELRNMQLDERIRRIVREELASK